MDDIYRQLFLLEVEAAEEDAKPYVDGVANLDKLRVSYSFDNFGGLLSAPALSCPDKGKMSLREKKVWIACRLWVICQLIRRKGKLPANEGVKQLKPPTLNGVELNLPQRARDELERYRHLLNSSNPEIPRQDAIQGRLRPQSDSSDLDDASDNPVIRDVAMPELDEFIAVLNAECEILRKVQLKQQKSVSDFIEVVNSEGVKRAFDARTKAVMPNDPHLKLSDLVMKNAPRIQLPDSIAEPWRYYSPPMGDEHEHDHLRAVLEAGRHTVEVERLLATGDEKGAWRSLALAQGALLKSLSSDGKAKAKKAGNANGGKSKSKVIRERIFCIADDLLSDGHKWGGLAVKVSKELSDRGDVKKDDDVRSILNSMRRELLVDRHIHHIGAELLTGNHSADELVHQVLAQLESEEINETEDYVRQQLAPLLKHLQVKR